MIERFFDEGGGMQMVIHAPFGSRLNRAWGLALRKRFCRTFNFELQAAATEDAIVLSLGPAHSFQLDEGSSNIFALASVRDLLTQAAAGGADVGCAMAVERNAVAGDPSNARRKEDSGPATTHGRRRSADRGLS